MFLKLHNVLSKNQLWCPKNILKKQGHQGRIKKLRGAAITNTEMSVIYSEFMNIISEAKLGLVNTSRIQNYIEIIFLKLSFTDAEKTEFQNILDSTYLNINHTIPDATFLSTHTYNSTLNEVVPPDDGNEG